VQFGMLLVVNLAVALGMMFLLWLYSLAKKDASIVDSFWGPGFALIGWASFFSTEGYTPRQLLIVSLVTVWGLRLGFHIFTRNHGKGEDYRYKAMRKQYGDRFPVVSLFTVFGFQGLLMWFISMPLQIAQVSQTPARLTLFDYLGAAIWIIGFSFEAIGDRQLKQFKADPNNKGKVMNRGLWRYTRHPNYFGDATLWWGYYLIACAVPNGFYTVLSPLTMTIFLMNVSGVALLEKSLKKNKPGYAEYIARTSSFFPLPPKRES
jgi:steroid 5-alpha reductase family enzyme